MNAARPKLDDEFASNTRGLDSREPRDYSTTFQLRAADVRSADAHQLCRVPRRQQTRRHRDRPDSGISAKAELLRVGNPARAGRGELDDMKRIFGLHPLAVEDAQAGHQRPKIEEYGTSLFSVLHIVERRPNGGEFHGGELEIFADPTTWCLSPTGSRRTSRTSGRDASASRICSARGRLRAIRAHGRGGRRLFPLLDCSRMSSMRSKTHIRSGGRASREHRRVVCAEAAPDGHEARGGAAARRSFKSVGRARAALCAGIAVYFRDVYDHLQRLNQTEDSIRDTIARP